MSKEGDGAPRRQRPTQCIDETKRRHRSQQFAKAIARAEFGRAYWDEARERALKEALRRKLKGKPKKKPR